MVATQALEKLVAQHSCSAEDQYFHAIREGCSRGLLRGFACWVDVWRFFVEHSIRDSMLRCRICVGQYRFEHLDRFACGFYAVEPGTQVLACMRRHPRVRLCVHCDA